MVIVEKNHANGKEVGNSLKLSLLVDTVDVMNFLWRKCTVRENRTGPCCPQ